MIGNRIESRNRLSLRVRLFALAGAVMLVPAMIGDGGWAVASMLPFAVALAMWCVREPPFVMVLNDTSLEVGEPPETIPYDSIEGLLAPGREDPHPAHPGSKQFSMVLTHRNGTVRIPRDLNVHPNAVYRALCSQFTACGSRNVPSALSDHLHRQAEAFGADKVLSYRARLHQGIPSTYARGFAAAGAMLAVGIAWLILAGVDKRRFEGFAGGGVTVIVASVFTFLICLALRQGQTARVKNREEAGLIISPVGIAMKQGDLSGDVKWAEILDVRLPKRRSFRYGSAAAATGIILAVEGAEVLVADIYDRPIHILWDAIHTYWRRPLR